MIFDIDWAGLAQQWGPPIVKSTIIALIGLRIANFAQRTATKTAKKKLTPGLSKLLGLFVYYVCLGIIIITVLQQFNISVSALLGVAGVAGVAIGFAAKTSVANIISGIFLIAERTVDIGDTIESNGVTGVVESLDLFSVKLRTLDNKLVRISNENVLNKTLTNLSYYKEKKPTKKTTKKG